MDVASISVVIPTIGRPSQLRACLASLAESQLAPSEVVIVDQSGDDATRELVEGAEGLQARVLRQSERGIGLALNNGVEASRGPLVAVTHDDCTVEPDWLAEAASLLRTAAPNSLFTGRVLPVGDPNATPSTIESTERRDYTGRTECRVLYPSNMAFARDDMLAFGGFDPRFRTAAEDNDLCYRWLRSGHRLLYEPSLCVHHHDWRSDHEIAAVYREYGRAQGALYAKHARRGDLRMLKFVAQDLHAAVVAAGALARGDRARARATFEALRAMPGGFARGWAAFAD